MATKNLGKVAFVFKGDYSDLTPYNKYDVTFNGESSFLSTIENNLGNPLSDTNYWKPLCKGNYLAISGKADKTINITAGAGLTGGGDLSVDRTINVVATDDSITVDTDGIKVDTQNLLTSTSITKPLAANQGKVLDEKITQVGAELSPLKYEAVNVSYTKTDGAWISDAGLYLTSSGHSVSSTIALKKGYTIKTTMRATPNQVAVISKYQNGIYIPVAVADDNYTSHEYTYTADQDCNVIISGETSYFSEIHTEGYAFIYNIVKNIDESIPTINTYSPLLVKNVGGIFENGSMYEGTNYFYSNSMQFPKGTKITIESRDPSGNAIARISKWTEYGGFVKAISVGTTSVTTDTYTVIDDIEYLRFSGYNDSNYIFKITCEQTVIPSVLSDAISLMIPPQVEDKKYWAYAVGNILCIGDSLTEGAYYPSGHIVGSGASIKQNYPYMLGRMLNANIKNAGYSGMSASDWYLTHLSDYNYANFDTIILWLGTNNGLTDTLDTDVNPHTDYHDFAETETGYYCKIIESIKSSNNDIKIFLVKIFAGGSPGPATTNITIDKIATKYSLPVIDNSDLTYRNYPQLHGYVSDNPHFSKAGNIFVANRMISEIVKYLDEDVMRCEFGIMPFTREL